MQETEFWAGIDIAGLEEMRLRLRDLVPLLDKTKRHLVFTDFTDEITGVNEDAIIDIPRMAGVEYQRKVEQYLQSHLNNIVIHRLRTNQPLTASDLQELEKMPIKVGEEDGEALLKGTSLPIQRRLNAVRREPGQSNIDKSGVSESCNTPLPRTHLRESIRSNKPI